MSHPDFDTDGIAERLHRIKAHIAALAVGSGRDAASVRLVAVSKTHDLAAVLAAHAAGQRCFGENRVQEAVGKFSAATRPAGARLHLIGGVQTNKAAEAVRIADVIETLDRPALADAIARAADRAGRCPQLLVQVNIGAEPQKSGVMPEAADGFIAAMRARFGAALIGLMCIPPANAEPVPYFRALAAMAALHGLAELSMGMSGDYAQAIGCGATSVRIGTALFGARLQAHGANA